MPCAGGAGGGTVREGPLFPGRHSDGDRWLCGSRLISSREAPGAKDWVPSVDQGPPSRFGLTLLSQKTHPSLLRKIPCGRDENDIRLLSLSHGPPPCPTRRPLASLNVAVHSVDLRPGLRPHSFIHSFIRSFTRTSCKDVSNV